MRFRETKLRGVFEIDLEPSFDERGFFARSWCRREFTARGLSPALAQCNVSYNDRKGTLRGMHYQQPHPEAKLVRCIRGAIYDVALDLRRDSPTFRRWVASVLTAENRRALYISEGFAHGFQTLVNDTEVFYQMSEFYKEGSGRGVRWDDPAFAIDWPVPVQVISERDRTYPAFQIAP
jgi:dTDP-4-dehydrorhamnose 3,5-epimerase